MKQSGTTHLAELNIATAVDDLESERLADFVAALDSINALAERSPGLVERRFYESHPPRAEYVLTENGRAIGPVIGAMRSWGEKYPT